MRPARAPVVSNRDPDERPGDDRDKSVTKRPIGAEAAAAFLGVSPRHLYTLPIEFIKYSPRCRRWEPAVLEEFKQSCRVSVRKPEEFRLRTYATVSLIDSHARLSELFRQAGATGMPRRKAG